MLVFNSLCFAYVMLFWPKDIRFQGNISNNVQRCISELNMTLYYGGIRTNDPLVLKGRELQTWHNRFPVAKMLRTSSKMSMYLSFSCTASSRMKSFRLHFRPKQCKNEFLFILHHVWPPKDQYIEDFSQVIRLSGNSCSQKCFPNHFHWIPFVYYWPIFCSWASWIGGRWAILPI